jgi:hypothetical protein
MVPDHSGGRMTSILTRCPRTNQTISTGLNTDMVVFEDLPNVAIPVRCSACGSTHYWRIATAYVDGEQPLLAENRNIVRRLRKRAQTAATRAIDGTF